MPTPKERRQHAEECLKLANETTQIYARMALLELAAEFRKIAENWNAAPTQAMQVDGARAIATPARRRGIH